MAFYAVCRNWWSCRKVMRGVGLCDNLCGQYESRGRSSLLQV